MFNQFYQSKQNVAIFWRRDIFENVLFYIFGFDLNSSIRLNYKVSSIKHENRAMRKKSINEE
ncbi:hypothetical protein BpHYR1_035496 [Brachionus plicatilis]|uniref:Uncharacterized protein n=1 Tax=Brachionus plicatilis TaxID=10195 RepID=A0A3M7PD01_BRAPC|nr:hypothetical protein BpHYR1_035496 [Brachionus plicatilis]